MTPEQKELVKANWKDVEPISEAAAKLFYDKLFELDPAVRSMFKGDMKEQGKKLMQMIGVAVHGLDNLGELTSAIAAMGKRHAGYGVQESHYNTVGSALLWTLEKGLGEKFTADAKEAWTTVYLTLASVMQDAATEAGPA